MSLTLDGPNKKITCTVDNGGTSEEFTFGVDASNNAYFESTAASGLTLNTNTFVSQNTLKFRNPADSTGLATFSAPTLTGNAVSTFPAAAAPSTYECGIVSDDSGVSQWTAPGVVYAYNRTGVTTANSVGAYVTIISSSDNFNIYPNFVTFDTTANTFTLPAGMWLIKFNTSNPNIGGNSTKLDLQIYDETNSAYIGHIMSLRPVNSGYTDMHSNLIVHMVTLTASNTYSIRTITINGSPTLSNDFGCIIVERIATVATPYATSG